LACLRLLSKERFTLSILCCFGKTKKSLFVTKGSRIDMLILSLLGTSRILVRTDSLLQLEILDALFKSCIREGALAETGQLVKGATDWHLFRKVLCGEKLSRFLSACNGSVRLVVTLRWKMG
jgi:hypothetical protein